MAEDKRKMIIEETGLDANWLRSVARKRKREENKADFRKRLEEFKKKVEESNRAKRAAE